MTGLLATFSPLVSCPAISPFKELEIQIARSKHADDFFETTAQWTGKQLLYAELISDSTLFSEPVLDSFYVSSTNECFAHANYLLEALAQQDTSLAMYHQQQINPSCLPAQNFKDFYGVYLNWMQTAQFDSSDRATVTAIADECPILGGTVVFSARKFLESLDNIFIWHDDEICNDPSYRNTDFESTDFAVYIKVYPNPVNDILSIEIDQTCSYTITDITGKVVISGVFMEGLNTLETSLYNSGIYFMNLKLKSELISHKIAINH